MYGYVKAILYAYPHIESVVENIDGTVYKRAVYSYRNLCPCEDLVEEILNLTENKKLLLKLKLILDGLVERFSKEDLMLLDYKYFKQKDKQEFFGFDTVSRKYFRRQVRLLKIIKNMLEKKGIDEAWFNLHLNKIDFFKELLKRAKKQDDEELKKFTLKKTA